MYQDIIDIEQLLYHCCHAVDQGAINDILYVFHPRATMLIKWEADGVYVGHDAIGKWFENYDKTVKASLRYLRHKVTCPRIRVDGNEATSLSYLDVDAAEDDTGRVIVTLGHYDDDFVKADGRWWIKQRAIFIDGTYQGAM